MYVKIPGRPVTCLVLPTVSYRSKYFQRNFLVGRKILVDLVTSSYYVVHSTLCEPRYGEVWCE